MKTGYGLNTADSLGYLGYGSKPYSSLNYLGNKGYSSTSASGIRTKSALDKDTIMSKVKKPKLRKTSTDKVDVPLYKKKTFDFTDYAYREAVNRLKFLLTEAYEPTKAATSFYYRTVDDGKSEVSDSQSVVERPSLTEVSKYFPSTAVSRYGGGGGGTLGRRYSFLHRDPMGAGHAGTSPGALKPALSNSSLHPTPSVIASQSLEVAQPPPELLGFIEKQESYIEQLERESQYCREELSTLLKKVKDVVSENEALTDRTRGKGLYQLDSSESEDVDYLDRVGRDGKKSLSGPNIVFESRISELEAQLAQSQIDLKKLFNENEDNKRKLLHGASDVGNADAYRKQVENLQRDKQNLEETVRKLQLSIDQLKDSEACNFNKSQRSRDMIEQVAFERNQAEIEIRRLKDELERQHERVREVQHEMAKRLAEERSNAERRYTYHVDQLGGDLSSQWEHATKLQLEVERMKRIESDYKRELNQKNTQIDELKMELKNKSAIFMSDLNQGSAEKQSLEQEITSLRLQLERTERQAKVEVSRLNAEITSLRQRLDRADADLLHSKRENLKLADDVSSLEKELTLGELNRETRPSKELAKIISDMEAKHTNTVSELEGMIQDQKQLMEKLTAECKSLTHKLEDTTQKHKQEIGYLQENLEFLSKHINTSSNATAISNDTNQYASTNPIADVNHYSNSTLPDTAAYNPAGGDPYGSTGLTSDPSSAMAAATTAAAYSSPSPNQSIARDDVNNYEAINSGSRPGSTAARYPPAPAPSNGSTVPPAARAIDDGAGGRQYGAGAGAGKSSRPESRTSDRQQYPAGAKQPPELSRNNSVIDYGGKYETGERRSESRLSRSSVTNDDGGGGGGGAGSGGGGTGTSAGAVRPGGVPKEPEYGRGAVEQERLSRASDSTKPDSTGGGGSGRLSRESVADQQRASRQSMQSLVGSQGPAGYGQEPVQYGAADPTDATAAAYGQSQQPYGDFAYQQAGGEQYQPLDDQSASAMYGEGYDPSQQQQQYDGYGEQQQYDQQQAYDQQQYQGYQQPYDAQQYATEPVYDESSYATGSGTVQQPPAAQLQSPTQLSAPAVPAPSAAPAPTPAPAPTAAAAAAPTPTPAPATSKQQQQPGKSAVAVEQKEGNRAVGSTRSGASSRAGANGQRYKQPSGAGR
uniref:Uncharacterized protein n=1 Tax=Anopheles atroparvus TaxID=41427 RepID=A0AAG5DL98_ANOAO